MTEKQKEMPVEEKSIESSTQEGFEKQEKYAEYPIEIQAGFYCDEIVRSGEKHPEKEYEHEAPVLLGNQTLCGVYKYLHQDGESVTPDTLSNKQVLEVMEYLKENPVEEVVEHGSIKTQSLLRVVDRTGGVSVCEIVTNHVDQSRNFSVAQSALVAADAAGQSVDLNGLLPKGYSFVPTALYPYDIGINEVGMKTAQYVQNDMSAYSKGGASKENMFFVHHAKKKIAYGNITEEGSLLRILHEIGHAWQGVNFKTYGSKPYEDYLSYIRLVSGIMYAQSKDAESLPTEEALKKNAELQNALVGMGVTDLQIVPASTGEGMYRLSVDGETDVLFSSDRVDTYLKDFESQERQAWSTAVRVNRFLEKNDITLEPTMSDEYSIGTYIDARLNTYQKGVKEELGLDVSQVHFVHGGNYKKEGK